MSDGMSSRFRQIVDRLPVRWETLVGMGISYYLNIHDPERVNFEKWKNGYRIEVKTNGVNAEEAYEFWKEHVEPELGGKT